MSRRSLDMLPPEKDPRQRFVKTSKQPLPSEPPGDIPDIAQEYQYMGVTKTSGEDDKHWKSSDHEKHVP